MYNPDEVREYFRHAFARRLICLAELVFDKYDKILEKLGLSRSDVLGVIMSAHVINSEDIREMYRDKADKIEVFATDYMHKWHIETTLEKGIEAIKKRAQL